MRYCRIQTSAGPRYARIEAGAITAFLHWDAVGDIHMQPCPPAPLDPATLLAPVEPSKIICVGRNYREHATELGHDVPAEPLLFFKPPSSVIGPGEAIRIPPAALTRRVDFEGELGVIIGRCCRDLTPEEDVRPFIRGYTCVNDVTARDIQKKDSQWARAKGFDTFCPVGPIVVTPEELDPWAGAEVSTTLNGERRQVGNTRDFIFPLDRVIRYITQVMTLQPGDLIPTGTPAGVGPMQPGDVVEVAVSGIGALRNPLL
jgi:2-keto-4-pentenoate hydratase/2-oxohepta-3-ene-1,7-dioic acid hydratase in catechol pathway